jgi:hypothetical protein
MSTGARRVVSARLSLNRDNDIRILCGRPTGGTENAPRYDCSGDLGNIQPLAIYRDDNPSDPDSYEVRTGGWRQQDAPTVGGYLISAGLVGAETAVVTEIIEASDWYVVGPDPWGNEDVPSIVRYIWVAHHARGYRRREDGDYDVLKQRSATWDARRLTANGRARGRRPLPEAQLGLIGDPSLDFHMNRDRSTPPPQQRKAVLGARPALGGPTEPTIIRCPKCQWRNAVHPPPRDVAQDLIPLVRGANFVPWNEKAAVKARMIRALRDLHSLPQA